MALYRWLFLSALLCLHCPPAQGGWEPIGPYGGDARSLAADPANPGRMYLGTRTGQVYMTDDGGRLWTRLAGLRAPSDWVVDELLIDPADTQVIYAGMWSVREPGGGVYKSADGGQSWRALEGIQGQSVRALGMAPSDPQSLAAGTLEGVFRSQDGGAHWQLISPPGHEEIRNVESVAFDPRNPEIIYAGTWHLPWKTEDGGAHWTSIKKGMIDDSDIFSIVADASQPGTVYASACTGIYRTDTGGAAWRKIQGIPYSSRRTRALALDPADPQTLYAGTTEGLWRTRNGGESWSRLTSHEWVINALVIDPADPRHIYLGMDQGGVMESRDGGESFRAANRGFAQLQVSRVASGPDGRIYAGLLHAGQFGSVLASEDGGRSWRPAGSGLERRDVLSLLAVNDPSWRLLAGTADGVYEYSPGKPSWEKHHSPDSSGSTSLRPKIVWDLFQRQEGGPIYAATSGGLLESDDGREWRKLPLQAAGDGVYAVAANGAEGGIILAATAEGLALSRDSGKTWETVRLGDRPHLRVRKITPHPTRHEVLFAGTDQGLFRSTSGGVAWERFGRGIPFSGITAIFVLPDDPRHVLVAGGMGLFHSLDGGGRYDRLDGSAGLPEVPIQFVTVKSFANNSLLAVSAQGGLFLHDAFEALLSPLQK